MTDQNYEQDVDLDEATEVVDEANLDDIFEALAEVENRRGTHSATSEYYWLVEPENGNDKAHAAAAAEEVLEEAVLGAIIDDASGQDQLGEAHNQPQVAAEADPGRQQEHEEEASILELKQPQQLEEAAADLFRGLQGAVEPRRQHEASV